MAFARPWSAMTGVSFFGSRSRPRAEVGWVPTTIPEQAERSIAEAMEGADQGASLGPQGAHTLIPPHTTHWFSFSRLGVWCGCVYGCGGSGVFNPPCFLKPFNLIPQPASVQTFRNDNDGRTISFVLNHILGSRPKPSNGKPAHKTAHLLDAKPGSPRSSAPLPHTISQLPDTKTLIPILNSLLILSHPLYNPLCQDSFFCTRPMT